ncbi:MAG: hypothetical protein WD942_01635 [Dehalococcoidia bacterium]
MSRFPLDRPRRWRGTVALSLAMVAAATFVACTDEGDSGGTGAALAERWMRVGQDHAAQVQVLERELPPDLIDLLNPRRTADTPAADLIAFPVHPEGELLGSYLLRRMNGEQVVWIFYDVPAATLASVTDTVSSQLDETPWQVVGRQGNRSFSFLRFENTRSGDVTGNAIVEVAPPADAYALTVLRDGAEVTLDIQRVSPTPAIEAELGDDLEVSRVLPGLARDAGLQEGDRIIRVEATDVSTEDQLQRAFEALSAAPQYISVIYSLEFASPADTTPPLVMSEDVTLPASFPARDAWAGLAVDEYQAVVDPSGSFFGASFLSEDGSATVTDGIRRALEGSGWTIVADEPVGLATQIQFERADERLAGIARIDESAFNDALTEVTVQIQTTPPGGN